MLPLEYAIDSGSPLSVIKFLQKASEKDWKQRREKSTPGDTHSSIKEKLIQDQQMKQKEHEHVRNRERNRLNNSRSSSEQDRYSRSKQASSMFAKTA